MLLSTQLAMGKANEQQCTSGSAADWAQAEQNKPASQILAFKTAIQIKTI